MNDGVDRAKKFPPNQGWIEAPGKKSLMALWCIKAPHLASGGVFRNNAALRANVY